MKYVLLVKHEKGWSVYSQSDDLDTLEKIYRTFGDSIVWKLVEMSDGPEAGEDMYTDQQAVEHLSRFVAAVTSGVKGAIPESEDKEFAEQIVDMINSRFDDEIPMGLTSLRRHLLEDRGMRSLTNAQIAEKHEIPIRSVNALIGKES